MVTLQQILIIGIAPALAAAAFFLIWLIMPAEAPRGTRLRAGLLLSALALASTTALAHVGLFGPPTFPPTSVTHTYFWAALLALIPVAATPARHWPRVLSGLAVAALLAWMLLRRKADNEDWATLAFINWTALVALGITAVGEVWHMVARSLSRDDSRLAAASPAIIFGVVIASAAPVVLMAGSLDVPSKLLGAIAATIMALAVVSFVLRDSAAAFAAAAVGGLVLPTMLLHAALYSTLDWGYLVPLCLAPAGALAALLPPFRNARPLLRTLIMLGGAGLIAAAPAIIAVSRHAHEY